MGYGTIDIFCLIWLLFDLFEGRAYDVDTLFHSFRAILAFFFFPFFFFFSFFLLGAGF
jgi:hypothetical protein